MRRKNADTRNGGKGLRGCVDFFLSSLREIHFRKNNIDGEVRGMKKKRIAGIRFGGKTKKNRVERLHSATDIAEMAGVTRHQLDYIKDRAVELGYAQKSASGRVIGYIPEYLEYVLTWKPIGKALRKANQKGKNIVRMKQEYLDMLNENDPDGKIDPGLLIYPAKYFNGKWE